MKTIVLPGYGYWLGRRSGMLVIKKAGGEKREVSIGNVGRVVANARGLSISGDALYLMLRYNVHLILTSRSRPVGILHPLGRSAPIALKKRQVLIQDSEAGFELARGFVYGKLMNQVELLRQLRRGIFRRNREAMDILFEGYNEIKSVSREVANLEYTSDYRSILIGMEAEAAKIYWNTLSLVLPDWIGFDRRRKRFEAPSDPLNLGLNYLYSLLAGVVWGAVELGGLDPWIGYLHKDSNRRPSLVMDLMEEFRQPIVDKPLIKFLVGLRGGDHLVEGGRLGEGYRNELLKLFFERLQAKVSYDGYTSTYEGHINRQVRRLGRCIMGKSSSYKPFMRL